MKPIDPWPEPMHRHDNRISNLTSAKSGRPEGQIPNGCSIFSTSVWSLEVRPIIDERKGCLYGSIDPTCDNAFTGLEAFTRGIAKEVEP